MSYQVGIDLGTTFTAAAVHRDGRSSIFSLGSQTAAMPSVVLLREDETELTGEAAVRRALNEPERVAREFKRRLGDTTPIIVGGAPYSAEQLMARLLTTTLGEIAKREGGAPERIAITHPANWGPYKIDLLEQAVRIAGVPRDRVDYLTEPEAAAVSYATQERVEAGEIVAVYDLGGGTFDAAVLRRTPTGFEIIGRPEGIERMGGIDFDAAVFAHVNRALDGKLQELDPEDPMVMSGVARLRDECVDAKIALSSDTDATIPVLLPNLTTEVRITRSEFEALIRPSLSDSIAAMQRAIDSADITAADVSKVLLVGGSSRIPLISQMVSSELGRPVAVDADPKHAVALGAAAYAGGASSKPAAATPAPSSGDALTAASAAAAASLIVPADEVAGSAVAAPAVPPAAPALPPTEQQPAYNAPTQPMPAQPAAAAAPSAPTGFAGAAGGPPPMGATASSGASSSGSSKMPLILGGVVALLVVGIGAFVVLGGGGDDDEPNEAAVTTIDQPTEESVDDTVVDPPEETVVDTTVPEEPEETVVDTTIPEEPEVIDDETLSANVAAAVVAVSPDVQSSVTGGVATLIGQTDEASASAAVGAAAGVEGIIDVVSQITVLQADEICTDEMQQFDRWVCLNSVTFDGTVLQASFAFENAGQELSTAANHLHFYPDDFDPIEAGTPNGPGALSVGGAPWEVWQDPAGFTGDPVALFGAVPTRLCVEVANANHALENLESGNCWPVEVVEPAQGLIAPRGLLNGAPTARVVCHLDGISRDAHPF